MKSITNLYDLETDRFYLLHQLTASLLIALVGMLFGVLIAWVLLGRSKRLLKQVQMENQRLQEEWVDMENRNNDQG